jgi:acetylornithine deacetylase
MTTTLDILDRLIGFDTVSHNSNLALMRYAGDFLTHRGFAVTPLPSPCGQKMGLYAEKGPSGAGLMLSAHTDVVPVEGQIWSKDPFRLTREGSRVYGRGTTDMKGYVAAILSAADRAAQANLRAPLKIVLSYDEEIGCVGIQHMLAQLTPLMGQPDLCVVGEPTDMAVAIGHKGKAALRATCHGDSGHSALAPHFVNALHLAGDFMTELRAVQQHYCENGASDPAYSVPYTTVHCGVLTGGQALNIVPDRADLTFEYRHLAADSAAEIQDRITRAADRITARYQPHSAQARIELEQYNAYPGLDLPPTAPSIALAQQLAQRNDTTKVAFGTEAGFFADRGIPTVVCGPGSMQGQGHKPDEYLELEQLAACDRMMDRILARLCR